jgi:poly(hydroxyalkanoate) granule-associated protein
MAKVAAKKVEEKATLLTDVKHAARQIWLAGLGAYSKAGQEGADYLKDLIKSGESVEKQGKKLVTEQVEAANDTVKTSVSSVKEKVEVQLDKVEKAFDARVASALNRLGIPSKKDVAALSAKLDELSAVLEHASRNK